MTDIFQEVEEDVRRERYAQLWKQYGDYAVAGLVIVILGAAGLQVWRYYEHKALLKASAEYNAAQALMDSGHPEQAATAFAKLADTAPGGYAVVSRLHNADALLASGQQDKALQLYKTIAASDDPLLSAVARLREAWVLADTSSRLEQEALLAPLTDAASPWRFMAREILAYSDYRGGRFDAAKKEYESLAAEMDAPIGVRQRANAMATFLKAGGDKPYGSLPPPPAKASAPAATPAVAEKAEAKTPAKPAKASKHVAAHRAPAPKQAAHRKESRKHK